MRYSSLILVLVATALCAPLVTAHDKELPPPTVIFTGEAVESYIPDSVRVFCTIDATADTPQKAVALQAERSTDVLHKLASLGLPQSAITTIHYSLEPIYNYESDNKGNSKRVFGGYKVTQRLSLSALAGQVGELLNVLTGYKDKISVDAVQFFLNNVSLNALKDNATNAAIDSAEKEAWRRAKRLGIKLGPIVGYTPYVMRSANDMRMSDAAARSAAPNLPTGESEIRVRVEITYEILK